MQYVFQYLVQISYFIDLIYDRLSLELQSIDWLAIHRGFTRDFKILNMGIISNKKIKIISNLCASLTPKYLFIRLDLIRLHNDFCFDKSVKIVADLRIWLRYCKRRLKRGRLVWGWLGIWPPNQAGPEATVRYRSCRCRGKEGNAPRKSRERCLRQLC